MLGNYYTFPELLIWIPFVTGIITLFIRKNSAIKWIVLFSSLLTLLVSAISLFYADPSASIKNYNYYNVSYYWMPYLGSSFSVGLDGLGLIATFLTAFSFPLAFLSSHLKKINRPSIFYSLMLFLQCGLMGVFVSYDMLLFFIFWQLVFISVYFLNSGWGKNEAMYPAFKTFAIMLGSSLLMLAGILFFYELTPQQDAFSIHSFSLKAFYSSSPDAVEQTSVFGLFFLAFAVTIPLFPFHTWFAGTSHNISYQVTQLTGGVLTKMGIYLLLRWIIPLFPLAIIKFQPWLIGLSLAGFIYAAVIAYGQDDLKKMTVWICISTMGILAAGIFSGNEPGIRGSMLEMFKQGINITGLFIIFYIVENKTGISKLNGLKNLSRRSPLLTVFIFIILLSIIGFPWVNPFSGLRMIFSGLLIYSNWVMMIACLGFIATIIYLWRIVKNLFSKIEEDESGLPPEIKLNKWELISLSMVALVIIVVSIYPDVLLHLAKWPVQTIINRMGGLKI